MKVAVAHRERLTREAVRRALHGSDFQLLWSAQDEQELDRMQRRDPPDLLLLDASLLGPHASNLREGSACLVLAADESAPGVFEALSAGALGHVPPPRLEADGELTGASRLLGRIARLHTLVTAPVLARTPAPAVQLPKGRVPILALGASTGGPQALARVLSGLPAGLAAAVLIVQHIDGEFSEGLAEWLGTHSLLPVQLARRGDWPQAGQVYVGGSDGHLVLLPSQQLGYRSGTPGELHVPSVDVLFGSLAEHARPGAAALLSGMGSDGAGGLLRLRQAGWHTIAQDEASSAVYGMPRAALEAGAAAQVLPLAAIGAALARALSATRPLSLR